jgi:hypothetical protein
MQNGTDLANLLDRCQVSGTSFYEFIRGYLIIKRMAVAVTFSAPAFAGEKKDRTYRSVSWVKPGWSLSQNCSSSMVIDGG